MAEKVKVVEFKHPKFGTAMRATEEVRDKILGPPKKTASKAKTTTKAKADDSE